MIGSLLTQWTIRLALACLAAYLAARLLQVIGRINASVRREPSVLPIIHQPKTYLQTIDCCRMFTSAAAWETLLRSIWTVGCVLFIAHVVCAFQFTHHWSHAHAWQHTADETKRMMGVAFGDGIYFSYLFLLLWVADVVTLWLNVRRPLWFVAAAYLFLFFIAFNGAIVFEAGPTRPIGILTVVLVFVPLAAWLAWVGSKGWQHKKEAGAPLSAECEA